MLVISKKRLEIILGAVMLSIFTVFIANQNVNIKKDTVETVALPVTNKVIVIDARTSESQMRVLRVVMEQQKQKQI